jgi:lysophospholipase L1-like esterase
MKRIIICVLCLLCVIACSGKKPKNFPNNNTGIVAIGDSLTEGYGVPRTQSYPAILARLVTQEVINLGVSGNTSADGMARAHLILTHNPYMVIIGFGGNDFRQQMPPETTKRNILEIVRVAQGAGAITVILDTDDNMFMKRYSNVMKEIAAETDSIYVEPILAGILNNVNLKSDSIHPNAEGYKLIAERIFRKIKNYLPEN